ncbi:MAG: hypothetical protein LBB58_05640 [Cellulomonadaceae bacterium]|nr:hypothetical protein [Cellulomonadaceae bacterium]
MSAVLDSAVVIGLLDPDDNQHEASYSVFRELVPPLYMHPINLAECFVRHSHAGTISEARRDLMELGIIPEPITHRNQDSWGEAIAIAEIRAESDLKIPDACTLGLGLKHPEAKFIAFDMRLAAKAREAGLTVITQQPEGLTAN